MEHEVENVSKKIALTEFRQDIIGAKTKMKHGFNLNAAFRRIIFWQLATLALRLTSCSERTPNADNKSAAVADNSPEALLVQGCRYKKGQGCARDVKLAEKYLKQAAELNNGKAWCELGELYEYTSLVQDNIEQAAACYQKAVELGCPEGYSNLASCYLNAYGVSYDAEKALALLRKGVEAGSHEAMHLLGSCYLEGKGVEPNRQEAEKWFAKSVAIAQTQAESGDDVALKNLGVWHLIGEGVPEDDMQSRSCFEKAHALGNLAATEYLATSYMYDETIPNWMEKTTNLLKELSDIGYPYAAMELFKLKAGDSLTCNKMNDAQREEFANLVKQLDERGSRKDPFAYMELGFIFGEYLIDGRNLEKAEEYYRKAAEQGYQLAYYQLGMLARRNYPELAREYLEKAAASGCMDALGELCIADAWSLALINIKPNSYKTPEDQKKLEPFLADCARHLKQREKYGRDTKLRNPWGNETDYPEATFEEWLKGWKEAADKAPLARRVMELSEHPPED